jgi:hypothetical protein
LKETSYLTDTHSIAGPGAIATTIGNYLWTLGRQCQIHPEQTFTPNGKDIGPESTNTQRRIMNDSDTQNLSRRKWLGLGLASTPLLAASVGTGLLVRKSAAAESDNAASERNLGARTYNVRDFGAKGDGETLDTAAVQAAIDACHKDQGGTVLVPAGTFVIGTTGLKSNVALHIAAQGVLPGSGHGTEKVDSLIKKPSTNSPATLFSTSASPANPPSPPVRAWRSPR